LAERAGLHRTYISDVERGVRNPSLESIEKLAAALDLSVSHLFHRANAGGGGGEELEILLIEDEPADVQLTIRAFRRAGVTNQVRVVSDGEAALEYLCGKSGSIGRGKQPPGVILLDLHLPKLSGLEVLRRIKADKRTRNIPVIVLTSSQQDEDVAECARLGVENYIVKPVDFQNFSEVTPLLKFKWALVRPA
jgi:CheY-like chemotaxis protein